MPPLEPRIDARDPRPVRGSALWGLLLLSLAGCSFGRFIGGGDSHVPPPLPSYVSKDELVGHLNANIAKVRSWRSTDVDIQARGGLLPVRLDAVIAVEGPHNFRMRVSSKIAGDEADLGSNDERFWFWMRRGEPKHVFTAQHEQMALARQRLPIPFEPDWLMEVLGVVPIDPEGVSLEFAGSDSQVHRLVSQRTAPDGRVVRRVIDVDVKTGHILRHALYDMSGQTIAQAKLGDYEYDAEHDVFLPHRIELDWPQAGLSMSMTLRDVDLNLAGMPEQTWQMPEIRGYPTFDLGRGPQPARRHAAGW